MATMRDEKLISAIRRQVATAFNSNSVHQYEHHIDLTIEGFLDILHTKGPRLDMRPLLSFFSFDTICRLAFSDTMNLMQNQADVDSVIAGGRARMEYWHKYFAIPELEALLYKNRFSPSSGAPSTLLLMAKKRIDSRVEKGGAGVYHDLLDRILQARGKDPDTFTIATCMGLTMSIIHAGSETTGHTLANLFWDLCNNTDVFDRLKREVRAAGFSSPPKLSEVRQLPFIEACLKESMRMQNVLTDPMERVVPGGGATICDVWLPGGTVVCKSSPFWLPPHFLTDQLAMPPCCLTTNQYMATM
jgi:cytochrome P450